MTTDNPNVLALREARSRSGLTLREAAPRLGIDFTYLSKVENGHERPSDALLLRMCDLYGLEPDAVVLARAVAEVPAQVRAAIEAAALTRGLAGSGVECGLVGCDLLELLIGILAEGPNGEYATIDAMERAAKAIHMEWHEAQGRWITTDRTRPFQPATPPTAAVSVSALESMAAQWKRQGDEAIAEGHIDIGYTWREAARRLLAALATSTAPEVEP